MTLRDAIDKDQFYVENVSYSDDDIKAMPLDRLETLRMQIQKKIDGLTLWLKEKEKQPGYMGEAGIDSDGQFFIKTTSNSQRRALYLNKRVLAYVNILINSQRQKKKSLADYFIEYAKQILSPMLFEQILDEAQKSARSWGKKWRQEP